MPPVDHWWSAIRDFGSAFNTVLVGALGTAVGFALKWLLEQWSVRAAARREFARTVTSRIAELANMHYWSLANYAGLLAGLLDEYLSTRVYNLMLLWDDYSQLPVQLDDLAKEAADKSFPHFCHMIALFNAFQFNQSNTYLLTHHKSGESCKRLYNTIVASLSDNLNKELANVYQQEIPYGTGSGKSTFMKISDLPAAALTDAIVQTHLSTAKEAWRAWLRDDPAGVSRAADALRAYNELLNHELALLYKDWLYKGWFKTARERISLAGITGLAGAGEWPHVLSGESLLAIGQSRFESTMLRPLGTAVSSPGATRASEPKAPERGKDDAAGGPPGRAVPGAGGEAHDKGDRADPLAPHDPYTRYRAEQARLEKTPERDARRRRPSSESEVRMSGGERAVERE